MTDQDKLAAMRILSSIFAAAYFSAPEILPLIVFKQINLSVKHGNTALSTFAYAWYGLLLCGKYDDLDSGYEFGQLALTLLSHFDAKQLKAKIYGTVNSTVKIWKYHIKETLEPLLEGYQIGLETGDLEYASYCGFNRLVHSYFIGQELTELEIEFKNYSTQLGYLKQETTLNFNLIYQQAVMNMISKKANFWQLIGEAYNEEKMLLIHQ